MAVGQHVFMKNRIFFILWGNRRFFKEIMKFFVWMPCLYFSIQHLSQHHSLFPLKNKTAKNNKKTSLKCLNSWQVSKSLRVSLVVFSRDQYWAQSYWKFSWMSRKLILNPADKIFSGGMISSALTMIRTERDFGSLEQNKCKLLCLVRRNVGQAGKWETS